MKGKISKAGLRRLVWMVIWCCLVGAENKVTLWSPCPGDAYGVFELPWWRLRSVWAGSGIECWCGEAILIVPVVRVFLLIVSRSLVCWLTTSVRLVEGNHRFDRHEQFGSSYWSGTALVSNSPYLLEGAAQPATMTIRANTNPHMQAVGSIELSSNRYLAVQICANTHIPSFRSDHSQSKSLSLQHTSHILACRSVIVYS
jgi:hypothetical protein